MLRLSRSSLLKVLLVFVVTSTGGSSLVCAQVGIDVVKKTQELLDEMKEYEKEQRSISTKKIADECDRALKDLYEEMNSYYYTGDSDEWSAIRMEISKISKKKSGLLTLLKGSSGAIKRDDRKLTNNGYFLLLKPYYFEEEGSISGKFFFTPSKQVRATYKYKGESVKVSWPWEDMGDHIRVDAGPELGPIIISDRPKSEFKAILIRWGGELKNKLTDAATE